MMNKIFNIIFIIYFSTCTAWANNDGYAALDLIKNANWQPQALQFNPLFLLQHSPLKSNIKNVDLSTPMITNFPLLREINEEFIRNFFTNFAQEKRYLKQDINTQNLGECIKVNTHPINSFFATFIAEIKIAEECSRNKENTHWFLKEVASDNIAEIENLWFLNKHRDMFSHLPNDIKILIPQYFFSYPKTSAFKSSGLVNRILPYNLSTDRNYFYLVPTASGSSIASLFNNAVSSNNYQTLELALKEYAKSMAFFHQNFMDQQSIPKDFDRYYVYSYYRTILHGDAHWGNIFFDKNTGTISFIDNESIAKTIERGETAAAEMGKLLFYSASNFGQCHYAKFDAKRCRLAIDANIFFLKNYINNYPLDFQNNLKTYFLSSLPDVNEKGTINQFVNSDAIQYWTQELNKLLKQNH